MGNYELGHLLHMPTHLDIQVGDYQAVRSDIFLAHLQDLDCGFFCQAMDWNIRAYKADKKLYEFAPQRFNIYMGYLIHNLEFCAWAAMFVHFASLLISRALLDSSHTRPIVLLDILL